MVFCNIDEYDMIYDLDSCHNPYFNRWFSAIPEPQNDGEEDKSHNPYFNRWFSAIHY